jgi:hypothetical protein
MLLRNDAVELFEGAVEGITSLIQIVYHVESELLLL